MGGRWRRRAAASSSPTRSFNFATCVVSASFAATNWESCAAFAAAIFASAARSSAFSRRSASTVATAATDHIAAGLSIPLIDLSRAFRNQPRRDAVKSMPANSAANAVPSI